MASNTQTLVHRNIAAGAMRASQEPTSAAVVFSPSGQLVAWTQGNTLTIRDRCARRQVFSQLLPPPPMQDTICWSHDSSQLILNRALGVFVADLASCEMTKLQSGPRVEIEQCSWAPSAQSVALVMSQCGPHSLLFLYQGTGAELQMVHELRCPLIRRLVWASNSRVLAVLSGREIGFLNTYSRALFQWARPGISGSSVAAWSPLSWDAPHLLCTTRTGEVLFIDHRAALKGRCEEPVQDASIRDMAWGEHGVVIITGTSLWLLDVCRRFSGLVLDSRHQVMLSGLTRPVLSPDQVHVCMLQATNGGSTSHHDLVVLNVVSGCQALISLPEPLSGAPVCSWTRSGCSLAVTMVTDHGRTHMYKMFRFVF